MIFLSAILSSVPIDTTLPSAEVVTEQPIAWHNDVDQVTKGWIDAQLMLSNDDHILVDHKSHPDTDPIGQFKDSYLGQLATHSQALEPTARGRLSRVFIHLSLLCNIGSREPCRDYLRGWRTLPAVMFAGGRHERRAL